MTRFAHRRLGLLGRTRRMGIATVLAILLLVVPLVAAAHPLGNFSVNRYTRLELFEDRIEVIYVLDMAEIPTVQARPEVDLDGDKTVSDAEAEQYGATLLNRLQPNLLLTVNGAAQPLTLVRQSLTFPEGQGGLATTRFTARFQVLLAEGELWEADFQDVNFADRLGWSEVVVQGMEGVAVLDSTVPAFDLSQELQTYPTDLLQSPPATHSATFRWQLGGGVAESSTAVASPGMPLGAQTDRFASLINLPELTPQTLLVALVLAFLWGGAHALSPGHGKTIVAAYLVGSRGTARHALFLGLTTTITHTAGVFALGFVTLILSRWILPEQLYPWLGALSGLLVIVIGLQLFQERLRGLRRRYAYDHSHGAGGHDANQSQLHSHDPNDPHSHSHLPPGSDDGSVTWRSLLTLGVSGGLLPCPSALVVLLSAIALGRVGLGLLLIIVFSLGLASVLTGIGLLMVYAGRLFQQLPVEGRIFRALPVLSALFITLAGAAITWQALAQTGVVRTFLVASGRLP